MIRTLAWKEFREHWSILLTMVVMTCALGVGLIRLVAVDLAGTTSIAAITILGMAAAYGVVCGAMMFAGEHEGGTLAFLDIFLGRRGLLWCGKFLIGIFLVLVEAAAVALLLHLVQQQPPAWLLTLLGLPNGVLLNVQVLDPARPAIDIWSLVLPIVTLEAFAWGLLGSALTRRVLSGAAIAAMMATPVWLMMVFTPAPVFVAIRLAAVLLVLIVSYCVFTAQSRETRQGPPPEPDPEADPRRRFIALWEEFEEQDDEASVPARPQAESARPGERVPVPARPQAEPASPAGPSATSPESAPPMENAQPASPARKRRRHQQHQADSASEVLWWLTLRQAWGLVCVLAAARLLIGFQMPSYGEFLWPLATLLLGIACGTAAFGPEQRELSYQFLAAQHFPLNTVWRFKILFWLAAAALAALMIPVGGVLELAGRFVLARLDPVGQAANEPIRFEFGTLMEIMGPVLFFGVWLVYGFCVAQVLVWLCRKNILALLLASLVSAAALAVWLPSVLCRGMNGWQLWVPPLVMLVASRFLVRAWAGGRIRERKPLAALAGFAAATLAWAGSNFAYRAVEIPNVGPPLDPLAFRAALPAGEDNVSGQKFLEAIVKVDQPKNLWLVPMAEAAPLPVGIIEYPRSEGHAAALLHLPACGKITTSLRDLARAKQPGPAFEHLAQILALSRSLRNKAPLPSYLAGTAAEQSALEGLDHWLTARPSPELLRRALDALNRHAAETPPPMDCLRTECFRAGGMLLIPTAWNFAIDRPGQPRSVPEAWLSRAIALSLEMPWEEARKTRLWQLIWAGYLRGMERPYWELPDPNQVPLIGTETTRKVLGGWMPSSEGPAMSMTAVQLAGLLQASWLSDERLYTSVVRLRGAATRSQWRVAAARQVVALGLYRLEQGKPAQALEHLVPKYMSKLPIDPYSGQPFRYRISPGEPIDRLGDAQPGQGVLWSAGPDRINHGGHNHGGALADDDPQWLQRGFDLVTLVPQWP